MKEAGLSTPEQVYEKYRDHWQRLRDMRDRAGPAFTAVAEVQLRTTESFTEDLARVLFGTDGHGRVLHPEEEERKSA